MEKLPSNKNNTHFYTKSGGLITQKDEGQDCIRYCGSNDRHTCEWCPNWQKDQNGIDYCSVRKK